MCPMKTLGLPIKSSGGLTAIRKPAPWLGQHSAEVLRRIGYADADISAPFAGGVVYDRLRAKATAIQTAEGWLNLNSYDRHATGSHWSGMSVALAPATVRPAGIFPDAQIHEIGTCGASLT